MSFAAEIRQELCGLEAAACCRHAEIYGLLLFGHSFSAQEIIFQTESDAVARHAAALLAEETGVFAEIRSPLKRTGAGVHTVSVPAAQCEAVLEYFGHSRTEPSLKINCANMENECCAAAFLRGVFLSCGTVTDPRRQYHFEFSVQKRNLFHALEALTGRLPIDVSFGSFARKNEQVLYCKASEEITDLLTYLGAVNCSMKMMQIKMVKEVRNTANRLRNLDTANIDKTVSASAQQLSAIRTLRESGRLEQLPEQLQTLARLREENPEMSLRELGERLEEPLSRSGVNHRLERLIQLAAETSAEKKTK